MCTEPTLSMQHGTYCSQRRGNSRSSQQHVPETIAPKSDALRFYLTRVHYQAMVWRNAHRSTPELPVPSEMGWRLGESGLQPVVMSLSPIPDICLEMVAIIASIRLMTKRLASKLIMVTESCSRRTPIPRN